MFCCCVVCHYRNYFEKCLYEVEEKFLYSLEPFIEINFDLVHSQPKVQQKLSNTENIITDKYNPILFNKYMQIKPRTFYLHFLRVKVKETCFPNYFEFVQ